MQLNPKALGLTAAILSGGCWLLMMVVSLLTGIGEMTLRVLGSWHWHPFFSYTWGGMVIIVIEHLIGGFIAGYIFAVVYNKLLPKSPQV
jgi:hypothetical protein